MEHFLDGCAASAAEEIRKAIPERDLLRPLEGWLEKGLRSGRVRGAGWLNRGLF